MSAGRLVLRLVVTVLAAATLVSGLMAIGLLYHYFGPPDDFVVWLHDGAEWAPLPAFVAVGVAGGGLVPAHPAVKVVAGIGVAITAAIVVVVLAFAFSRPVDPGGEQGNLYDGLQSLVWTALAVTGAVLAWRASWPVAEQRAYTRRRP